LEPIVKAGKTQTRLALIVVLVSATVIASWLVCIVLGLGKLSHKGPVVIAGLEVSMLSQCLRAYVEDESDLPAGNLEPDPRRNDFPLLYEALFGGAKAGGKGGRNAPYAGFGAEKIAVALPGSEGYRTATPAEIREPAIKKYLLDPWGSPYVYRAGKTLSQAKIYSIGPNEEDDTVSLVRENDDIGNW